MLGHISRRAAHAVAAQHSLAGGYSVRCGCLCDTKAPEMPLCWGRNSARNAQKQAVPGMRKQHKAVSALMQDCRPRVLGSSMHGAASTKLHRGPGTPAPMPNSSVSGAAWRKAL